MRNLLFLFAIPLIAQQKYEEYDVIPKTDLSSTGILKFLDKQTTPHYIEFKAPASISTNMVEIWPAADLPGCLSNDGAGNYSWVSCSGSGTVANGFIVTNKTAVGPPTTVMGSQNWYDPSNHSYNTLIYDASNNLAPWNVSGIINTFGGQSLYQTASANGGGYLRLTNITYNPGLGPGCNDIFGNPVHIPIPLAGDTFISTDAVLWVSTSPLIPSSCGSPIPSNNLYGLNLNTYFLAMGGLATTNTAYNSIDSLLGGIHVKLGATVEQALYPKNNTVGSLNTPASGYGGFAHQSGGIYLYWNDLTSAWNTFDFIAPGSNEDVIFNCSGAWCASNNFQWDGTKIIVSTTSGIPGISVLNGYIQADGGFLTTGNNYQIIQAPNGGFFGAGLGLVSSGGKGEYIDFVPTALAMPVPLTGATFGGSDVLVWASSDSAVGVGLAGYYLDVNAAVSSGQGFVTLNPATNSIQAPNGGVTGKWVIPTDSIIYSNAQTSAPPLSGSGQARIYLNQAGSVYQLEVSYNGGAYGPLSGNFTLESFQRGIADCNMVGGGATDNFTALSNCITGLPSNGGVIWVPPGIFALNTQLTITKPGVTLKGSGGSGYNGDSLSAPYAASQILCNTSSNPCITFSGVYGGGIDSLQINGDATTGTLVQIYNSYFIKLQDSLFTNNSGDYSVKVRGGGGACVSGHIEFNNLRVETGSRTTQSLHTGGIVLGDDSNSSDVCSIFFNGVRINPSGAPGSHGLLLTRTDNVYGTGVYIHDSGNSVAAISSIFIPSGCTSISGQCIQVTTVNPHGMPSSFTNDGVFIRYSTTDSLNGIHRASYSNSTIILMTNEGNTPSGTYASFNNSSQCSFNNSGTYECFIAGTSIEANGLSGNSTNSFAQTILLNNIYTLQGVDSNPTISGNYISLTNWNGNSEGESSFSLNTIRYRPGISSITQPIGFYNGMVLSNTGMICFTDNSCQNTASSGSSTNYWTLTGSDISNNNSGNVLPGNTGSTSLGTTSNYWFNVVSNGTVEGSKIRTIYGTPSVLQDYFDLNTKQPSTISNTGPYSINHEFDIADSSSLIAASFQYASSNTNYTILNGLAHDIPGAAYFMISGNNNIPLYDADAYGNGSSFGAIVFRKAEGVYTSPLAVQSGDVLGAVVARGWNGSQFTGSSSAALTFISDENWGFSNIGAHIELSAIQPGTTNRLTSMKINYSGVSSYGLIGFTPQNTSGWGIPAIYQANVVPNQTVSQTTTVTFNGQLPPVGLYRISINLSCSATGTSGVVNTGVSVPDGVSSSVVLSSFNGLSLSGNVNCQSGLNTETSFVAQFYTSGTAYPTINTSVLTAFTGGASYRLSYILERLF